MNEERIGPQKRNGLTPECIHNSSHPYTFWLRIRFYKKERPIMRFLHVMGLFALFFGAVLWPTISEATHVRAGEITTRRLPGASLTYEITFTAYYDEVDGAAASGQGNDVTICFGDGNSRLVTRLPRVFINNRTSSINVYRTTYTYPGPSVYTVSVTVPNRNDRTLNLRQPSRDITFFVSTTIQIATNLGLNSTPVMLNPPLDSGRVSQRFCHNPAAFDADGDSLAYRLSIPKESLGGDAGCTGRNIQGYQDPTRFSTSSETGGAATFTINPRTGELCWDAPGQEGQFNFAFIVEEWRDGVLIGEITRDMQIIVLGGPNRRPRIDPLPDLCIEAGQLINQPVRATDPDGNPVFIEGFGGVFNVSQDGSPLTASELISPAYAQVLNGGTLNRPLTQPGTATFRWQTNCSHIRRGPYDVTFKVTDVPPRTGRQNLSLVSFQTLRIQIVGPSIKNLTARPTAVATGRAIQLSWSPYSCIPPNGAEIIIYRKEGCTDFTPTNCQTGLPAGLGYRELARVPVGTTTYTDTTALRRGVSYSYRTVVEYRDRNNEFINGGLSVASQEACLELPLLVPVMTQVTVDSTAGQRGQITVRWSRPVGLQPGDLGGPYQYRLQRATGLAGTAYTTIATIPTDLGVNTDTIYVDKGSSASALNTVANAHRYRVEFYYTNTSGVLTRLDAAEPAASVRLSAAPANRQISLTWQTNTPWNNDNQTHRVFRSRRGPNGPFELVADVPVRGPDTYIFVDRGTLAGTTTVIPLSADSSYCYRVLTRGRYTDTRLTKFGLIENFSQTLCATPIDTTRPCAPRLGLDSLNCASLTAESFCNQTAFTNKLRWQPTFGPTCDPNIASYNIYYARYAQDTLSRLTSVQAPMTTFDHTSLTTVAGCYYVTAVSKRGLESQPSNKVCNDACPALVLPNVFTPNGDGRNDTFEPMRCPRFVQSIEFVVYNRWGAKVYERVGPTLSWDGKTSDGTELPSGLYYYQATVRYAVVDRNAPPQVLKGWVQIIRGGGA